MAGVEKKSIGTNLLSARRFFFYSIPIRK